MNILIVDDEKEIGDLVSFILNNEGFETVVFYDSMDAYHFIIDNNTVDLALIDIMMPGMDGFTLLEKIREIKKFPVIMLSAKSEGADKIAGLTLGADDYITKPFNNSELIARVKAQLRRYTLYNPNTFKDSTQKYCSGISIDSARHKAEYLGKEMHLTPKEFDILWLLCENAGNVVSSEYIFESVWKEAYFDSNNTVMVHIRRIREKLDRAGKGGKTIQTVWGVGYKIEK